MKYETIFDISNHTYAAWPVLSVLGVLFVLCLVRMLRLRRSSLPVGTWRWLAGVLALTLVLGAVRLHQFLELKGALASGAGAVIEGRVERFWTNRPVDVELEVGPMREYEVFSVDGVRFQYYRDAGQPAFHNGGAAPLALANGMRVRIHYAADLFADGPGNRILRFEIAEDDAVVAWSGGAKRGPKRGTLAGTALLLGGGGR